MFNNHIPNPILPTLPCRVLTHHPMGLASSLDETLPSYGVMEEYTTKPMKPGLSNPIVSVHLSPGGASHRPGFQTDVSE